MFRDAITHFFMQFKASFVSNARHTVVTMGGPRTY